MPSSLSPTISKPPVPPISELAIDAARHSDSLLDKVYPYLFTLSSYLRLILPIQRWEDIVKQLDHSADELQKYLVATQSPPKRVGKEQLKEWAEEKRALREGDGVSTSRQAVLKEVSRSPFPSSAPTSQSLHFVSSST